FLGFEVVLLSARAQFLLSLPGGLREPFTLLIIQLRPRLFADDHEELGLGMVGDRDRLHNLINLAAAGRRRARHTHVDRAALVGNELLRPADLHRRCTDSVDEITRRFAEDANLLALDVIGCPDLAAARQELYGTVVEVPEDARTCFQDLPVDQLTNRAIGSNSLAEGFVVGKHEGDAEDRGHRDGPCKLVDEDKAHIDSARGYSLRHLAALVEL